MASKDSSHAWKFTLLMSLLLLFAVALWIIVGLAPLVFLSPGRTTFSNFWTRLHDVIWNFGQHKSSLSSSGTFGDTFGFANALFSGLAFVGVAVAIAYQRMQLLDQRTELEENAEAQRKLERHSILASNLSSATSLAQSYAQTIEITQKFKGHVGTRPARSLIAEQQMRKYRQIQEMLLFEVSNFERFFAEGREVLSIEVKRDYFVAFVRRAVSDWERLFAQYNQMDGDRVSERLGVIEESFHLLSFIHAETETFTRQDGVGEAGFRPPLEAASQRLLAFISSAVPTDDDKAVRIHFEQGARVISGLSLLSTN